jgi:hypothetical protein
LRFGPKKWKKFAQFGKSVCSAMNSFRHLQQKLISIREGNIFSQRNKKRKCVVVHRATIPITIVAVDAAQQVSLKQLPDLPGPQVIQELHPLKPAPQAQQARHQHR